MVNHMTKLVLTINGSDIIVSMEEARKLYRELSEIFTPPITNPYPSSIPGWPNIDTSKFVD